MDEYTQPHFNAMALITIDTQTDCLDGRPFEIPGTSAILPAMIRLVELFRRKGRPIVHIVRLYQTDGSNVDLCRRAMIECGRKLLAPGTEGSQLAPGLAPSPEIKLDPDLLLSGGLQEVGPGEVIIYKPRWGAFFKTPLEQHLRSLGVDTLVFSGCNYPNCPRTSIYQASERDFRIILITDAISGLYEKGAEEMKNIGLRLMTAEELTAAI